MSNLEEHLDIYFRKKKKVILTPISSWDIPRLSPPPTGPYQEKKKNGWGDKLKSEKPTEARERIEQSHRSLLSTPPPFIRLRPQVRI
jgi:hypothetical protein